MNEWDLAKRFGQAFGLCLRVGLMKEWLPPVRFIYFIRPTHRQRPGVVVARAVSVKQLPFIHGAMPLTHGQRTSRGITGGRVAL
jgi:hypothetical protein